MNHNLIIRDGNPNEVVKDIPLVDGVQFVDEKPRAGSTNLVTSGAVAGSVKEGVGTVASNFALEYDQSETYQQGSFVVRNGKLYESIMHIDAGEEWDPMKWKEVTLSSFIEKGTYIYYDDEDFPVVAESGFVITDGYFSSNSTYDEICITIRKQGSPYSTSKTKVAHIDGYMDFRNETPFICVGFTDVGKLSVCSVEHGPSGAEFFLRTTSGSSDGAVIRFIDLKI